MSVAGKGVGTSDIVQTLRGIARMTESEFLGADPGLSRLFVAREKASEARRLLPLFSGRAKKATARWSTACEAYERRRRNLVAVHRAARDLPWPDEPCWRGGLGHSEVRS